MKKRRLLITDLKDKIIAKFLFNTLNRGEFMNRIDIKLFENSKNLLLWFITMNFPEGYDAEQDISLVEFMEENYEFDDDEINTVTQYYDAVFDENDGYVDEPNVIAINLSNGKELNVAFHPGDIEYYIDDEMIGCTGPHYIIRKIPYEEYKRMVSELSSLEKLFVLPMVCVTDEHVDMNPLFLLFSILIIALILSDVQIEDIENTICSFILANSIE